MLTPSDKHLTHNTQSRHGGYKMQVTMTIPNWDLILNPFTRAFYTDCVGELKKVFQQKIVYVRGGGRVVRRCCVSYITRVSN